MWSQVGLRKQSLQTKLLEVMEVQLSYFKSWKMMWWKCCTQHASKFGKLNSGHRTGKGQFSFQSQRKDMPNNVQTTAQLRSSHKLVKLCSKFSKPGFRELPDVQARSRRGRETRDQIANIHWIIKKQQASRKTPALLTMPKPLTVGITTNWKILQQMGILDHLTCLLRNLYAGQEATLRTGQWTTD